MEVGPVSDADEMATLLRGVKVKRVKSVTTAASSPITWRASVPSQSRGAATCAAQRTTLLSSVQTRRMRLAADSLTKLESDVTAVKETDTLHVNVRTKKFLVEQWNPTETATSAEPPTTLHATVH